VRLCRDHCPQRLQCGRQALAEAVETGVMAGFRLDRQDQRGQLALWVAAAERRPVAPEVEPMRRDELDRYLAQRELLSELPELPRARKRIVVRPVPGGPVEAVLIRLREAVS